MAAPLLASLALLSSAVTTPVPLDQLFNDSKIQLPPLSLGDKRIGDAPLPPLQRFGDNQAVIPVVPAPSAGKKQPALQPLMPVKTPALVDPKLVHAPKDKDTDFKLIVKEVKVAEAK